eukprot:2424271-Prymnesium_polylepis.1
MFDGRQTEARLVHRNPSYGCDVRCVGRAAAVRWAVAQRSVDRDGLNVKSVPCKLKAHATPSFE